MDTCSPVFAERGPVQLEPPSLDAVRTGGVLQRRRWRHILVCVHAPKELEEQVISVTTMVSTRIMTISSSSAKYKAPYQDALFGHRPAVLGDAFLTL